MNEIFNWLADNQYKVVVDTCCYPNRRAEAASIADYKTKFQYYCKGNNADVQQIQFSNSFQDGGMTMDRGAKSELT